MNVYRALTTTMTLSEFMDIQEVASVARANKLALDVWLSRNPSLLSEG